MTPGPEAWEATAGVLGVIIFLGAAAVGLRRLGLLGGRAATSAPATAHAAPARAAPASDNGTELREINAGIADLQQRLARVETKLKSRSVDNLWVEHRDLAKSVARTKSDVARHEGLISQLGPLVNRLDDYLRTVQGTTP